MKVPRARVARRKQHAVLARLGLALAAVMVMLGLTASEAWPANFTWTGEAPLGTPNWSSTTNWGGTAPSGAVGTLRFPELVACPPDTATCYQSHNDLSGISANALSFDDGVGYRIDGNSISLGAGGLTASTTSAGLPLILETPLTLTAPQTWSIDATGDPGQVDLEGDVSGGANALILEVDSQGTLLINGDVEVGAVTISGRGGVALWGYTIFGGNPVSASLNGANGNPISVRERVALFVLDGSTGPITLGEDGVLIIGQQVETGPIGAGTLTVTGGVTLAPGSYFFASINHSGYTPGFDYSQLSASGNIALGDAILKLRGGEKTIGPNGYACEELTLGHVDAIITTSGSLTGTFSGVPNGATVPVECTGVGQSPWARIEYEEAGAAPHTVTATIVGPPATPANTAPPTISGTAQEGETLKATHGSWTDVPTFYSDQWEDCDSSGGNCQPISGASGQAYTLGAGDVGHTIRVSETATNGGGTSAPALSPPTSVVQAKAPSAIISGSSEPPATEPSVIQGTLILHLGGVLLLVKHNTVSIPVTCTGEGACKGSGTLTVASRSHGFRLQRGGWFARPAHVVIGVGHFSIPGRASGRLTIRLRPAGKRMLKQQGKLRAHLGINGTASGQVFKKGASVVLK